MIPDPIMGIMPSNSLLKQSIQRKSIYTTRKGLGGHTGHADDHAGGHSCGDGCSGGGV